jgi:hypothetical protein
MRGRAGTTPAWHRTARDMWRDGYEIQEIAAHCGVKPTSVRWAVRFVRLNEASSELGRRGTTKARTSGARSGGRGSAASLIPAVDTHLDLTLAGAPGLRAELRYWNSDGEGD